MSFVGSCQHPREWGYGDALQFSTSGSEKQDMPKEAFLDLKDVVFGLIIFEKCTCSNCSLFTSQTLYLHFSVY